MNDRTRMTHTEHLVNDLGVILFQFPQFEDKSTQCAIDLLDSFASPTHSIP